MTRGTRSLLVEILIVLALVNLAATVQTAQSIPIQLALGVSYPPGLRLGIAFVWTMVFTALVIRLLRRPRATIRWIPPILTGYGMVSLIGLILFARSDFDRNRIGFQALATVLLLAPIWWICRDRPTPTSAKGLLPQSPGQPPTESPNPH